MKTIRQDYRQRSGAMNKGSLGVGVDIERIDRFRTLNRVAHHRFLERIFTSEERIYCFSKQDPAPHLAVRFCAKEAAVKALSSLGIHKIPYRDIEITNDQKGTPVVNVSLKNQKVKAFVSISHTADYGIAFAVVERI